MGAPSKVLKYWRQYTKCAAIVVLVCITQITSLESNSHQASPFFVDTNPEASPLDVAAHPPIELADYKAGVQFLRLYVLSCNKRGEKTSSPAWKGEIFPLASGTTSSRQMHTRHQRWHNSSQKGKQKMATAKKATAATAAPAKKRTPNAAFMKPLTPSAALAAVVGKDPLPRTEIISKLWVYIKANNLQDASNKRMINADAKLKEVFGKPQVSMFEMAGLIGKHVS
jgi:hypothetical protein